jgi:putative tryptophan/tyrosine transport system substrate-binding protein
LMDGRKLQNRWDLILGLALLALCLMGVATAGTVKPVVVLLSSDDEAYTRPVATFTGELQMPVEVFNLHGDVTNYKERMREILSRNPALIFTLGAKAAYIAKLETLSQKRQDIPVVFAMVLNWEKYKLLRDSDNVAGIATDIDPGTQFANLAMFAPQVKKIGVIYSKNYSSGIITRARNVAQVLGYKLIAQPISRQREFRSAFSKISDNIQAYWILADPVVFSTRNLNWLKKRCLRQHIPTIGQSENVVKLGMLLGINTDAGYIGIQAASIARNILLYNQSPKSIGVMPPLGTNLVLNIKTANKIGLKINKLALDATNRIIE